MTTQSNFPPGWDEARVRRVLAHYEGQTEEEGSPKTKPLRRTKLKR